MTLPSKTEGALRQAWAHHCAGSTTASDRILLVLHDGRWHPSRELALKCGHRFGGALHRMKEDGIAWEKRHEEGHPPGHIEYRLAPTGQEELW